MHQSKFILAQSDENTFYSKISYAIYSKIRLRQNKYVYSIQLDCIRVYRKRPADKRTHSISYINRLDTINAGQTN